MSTYGTFVVFPCGIPHHNYHYNKTVIKGGIKKKYRMMTCHYIAPVICPV